MNRKQSYVDFVIMLHIAVMSASFYHAKIKYSLSLHQNTDYSAPVFPFQHLFWGYISSKMACISYNFEVNTLIYTKKLSGPLSKLCKLAAIEALELFFSLLLRHMFVKGASQSDVRITRHFTL